MSLPCRVYGRGRPPVSRSAETVRECYTIGDSKAFGFCRRQSKWYKSRRLLYRSSAAVADSAHKKTGSPVKAAGHWCEKRLVADRIGRLLIRGFAVELLFLG